MTRLVLLFDAGERVGWRLPKERLVLTREPVELPEAVERGDLGHGRIGRGAPAQRPPNHVHPAQQQVVLGTHAQMFLAAGIQGPKRCADLLAQLGNVKWFVEVLFGDLMEPTHDRGLPPRRRSVLVDLSVAEAMDYGFDERLFPKCVIRAGLSVGAAD